MSMNKFMLTYKTLVNLRPMPPVVLQSFRLPPGVATFGMPRPTYQLQSGFSQLVKAAPQAATRLEAGIPSLPALVHQGKHVKVGSVIPVLYNQRKDQFVSLTLCFTTQQVDRQREEKRIGPFVDCDGSPQCLSLRIEHCLFGGLSSSCHTGVIHE